MGTGGNTCLRGACVVHQGGIQARGPQSACKRRVEQMRMQEPREGVWGLQPEDMRVAWVSGLEACVLHYVWHVQCAWGLQRHRARTRHVSRASHATPAWHAYGCMLAWLEAHTPRRRTQSEKPR